MINILSGIESTGSALDAERIRMEVIGQNIANANTTRGANGRPYQRQQVLFETVLEERLSAAGFDVPKSTVHISRIERDGRPPRLVANPAHPDANPETGMVALPNINIHEEMVDLIASSRAFEANLAVARNARSMAMQTLAIGQRG